MGVTPYAAGQFTTYSLPAYAEQVLSGTGMFALNYAAKDVTASRTELGVRLDKSWAMQTAILTLRGRLAWAHDFNTDRNISAVFQTLPGASFVVGGAAQAHDSALTTASAEGQMAERLVGRGDVRGQFSNVTNSYAGKGVMRYSLVIPSARVGKPPGRIDCARPFSGTARSSSMRCPSRSRGRAKVLVKSLACGICGSDLHARKHAHRMVELSRHFPGRKPMDLARDVVFGHEFCCEILDYGPGTARR